MKEPQQALAAARAAAQAAGGDPEAVEWILEDPAKVSRRLLEWALIEPDSANVYSTRRYGQPITWFKRGLVHVLRQYLSQVTAQQSRFNTQIAAHMLALEGRVAELEQQVARLAPSEDRASHPPAR